MIEDITTTIKAQLYERVSSPLLSSFIISWCGWNYKFILILISGIPTPEKITYIDLNIFPNIQSMITHGAVLPLLTSLLLIFVYPIPAEFIYKHVKTTQRRLKEIQQSIDDESPLSKDQARKIRRESLENQLKYETEIDTKNSENSRLKEIITELQQTINNNRQFMEPSKELIDKAFDSFSDSNKDKLLLMKDKKQKNASLHDSDVNTNSLNNRSNAHRPTEKVIHLDDFMKYSTLDLIHNSNSMSGIKTRVTAKNGNIAIYLPNSDDSQPYITAKYTIETASDVIQTLKSALTNVSPQEKRST